MKTIDFNGNLYEVDDWVKFVAQDMNGSIFGYSHKPKMFRDEYRSIGFGEEYKTVKLRNKHYFPMDIKEYE